MFYSLGRPPLNPVCPFQPCSAVVSAGHDPFAGPSQCIPGAKSASSKVWVSFTRHRLQAFEWMKTDVARGMINEMSLWLEFWKLCFISPSDPANEKP